MSEIKDQLGLEDEFTFACHKGLKCYRSCCRDVTIFLTPYDVIRLKKALGLTSTEFLQKYTDMVIMPSKHLPMVQLRMNPEENLQCYFLRPHGCAHYPHRPWACRMFPLNERFAGGYMVIPSPERCHGLVEGDPWKVKEWLMDQGATQSKEMDGSYDSFASHEMLRELDITNEQIQKMIVTSLYDMDAFRDFVFKSSFLNRFELEPELIEAIKVDDTVLLELGYAWARFGLFGQKSLKLKEGAEQAGGKKK